MKKFQVSLSKVYKIKIEAETAEEAKRLTEFYTGDIYDISDSDKIENNKFQIQSIECMINDAFECFEVKNERN